jgi:Domain of unknown function (DUF4307)
VRSLGATISSVDQTLAERYAAPPAWRRPVTIAAVVVLVLVASAWLAWAAFDEATPKVESQLVGFEVVDAHRTVARVDVTIHRTDSHPRCTVQALASDHSIVGELVFTPHDGTNDVTVRTEREAAAVDLAGCTADGQDHPR